jgi:hypothetical protein
MVFVVLIVLIVLTVLALFLLAGVIRWDRPRRS